MNSKKHHRLFFALWPDNNTRQLLTKRLHRVLSTHPARKVPAQNWHVTLAFLGNVSEEMMACAIKRADLVQASKFTLGLAQFGFFKRARVAWLGCSQTPDELHTLFHTLNQALAPCGYIPDHKKLLPHMTLLRKASSGLTQDKIKPVEWKVDEFVLVESTTNDKGSVYKVIHRWGLG